MSLSIFFSSTTLWPLSADQPYCGHFALRDLREANRLHSVVNWRWQFYCVFDKFSDEYVEKRENRAKDNTSSVLTARPNQMALRIQLTW